MNSTTIECALNDAAITKYCKANGMSPLATGAFKFLNRLTSYANKDIDAVVEEFSQDRALKTLFDDKSIRLPLSLLSVKKLYQDETFRNHTVQLYKTHMIPMLEMAWAQYAKDVPSEEAMEEHYQRIKK